MSAERTTPSDLAWRAIAEATRGRYEVLAEIARDADGAVAFVGRAATATGAGDLTILKLEPEAATTGGERRYALFELRELDDVVPAPKVSCPVCSATVGQWRGRCPACGSVIGAPSAGDDQVSAEVLLAFYQFVSAEYDVVGELAQAGGGPPVYLVRRPNEDDYLLLRLALGGTRASGKTTWVVDLLPLRRSAAAPAARVGRVPLAVAGTTMAMPAPLPTATMRVCPQCGSHYDATTLFCPRDGASLRPVTDSGDLVGQLIDDRYYVEQRLGEGGMGEVYVAHQVRTGRKCALKLMHRAMTQDADAVGRFRREASSACMISHPNVATIYDSGETADKRPYFAMEFIDGKSLSQVIREEGPLDPIRAAELARQIAEGLGAAHDLHIVHRDLKPDNVMLGASRDGLDHVKLVDFGIAKPSHGEKGPAGLPGVNTLTRTGFILGTPSYMSPEQLCADPLDGRTDLYSLGCVLHEMLTGETPFAGSSLELVMMKRLTEAPPRVRTLNPSIPEPLDDVVATLLARARDERYPTARDAADALSAAMDAIGGGEEWRVAAGRRGRTVTTGGVAAPTRTATGDAVVVQTTNRAPRRSRQVAPAAPDSPPVPLRSPLGTAAALGPTDAERGAAMPAGRGARGKRMLLIGGAAVVAVAAAAFAAQRMFAPAPPPIAAGATPPAASGAGVAATSRGATPGPGAVNAPNAPPPPAPIAGAATGTGEPASGSATPSSGSGTRVADTRAAATDRGRALPPSAPSGTRDTRAGRAADASPPTSTPAAPPSTSPVIPQPTAITSAPASSATAAGAPPNAAPRPRDEPSAAEIADAARARGVIDQYVQAIGAKRLDVMKQLYPAMDDRTRGGYEALFRVANDLAARQTAAPVVTVRGSSADAQFGYELTGRDPARGAFSQRSSWRARLEKTSSGWTIESLSAQ